MSDFLEGQYTIDDVAETMGELPTRVITGIYVGDRDAYNAVRHLPSWSFCLAAQSFHRELLGYKGRGAPKDSPNYSYAIVDNTFYANLVDADNVKYVDPELIERMLTWCLGEYGQHRTLLVACDRGQSRSPTIALMLLRRLGKMEGVGVGEAQSMMNQMLNGAYFPGIAMREFLERWWEKESETGD